MSFSSSWVGLIAGWDFNIIWNRRKNERGAILALIIPIPELL